MANEERVINLAPDMTYSTAISKRFEGDKALNILYVNMHSIVGRMDILSSWLSSLPIIPDVVVVAETWLFDTEVNFFNLSNYTAFHGPARRWLDAVRGDGVAVYVRNDRNLDPSLLEGIHFGHSNILLLKLAGINIHIAAVYRPSSTSVDELCGELAILLAEHKNTIWVGDMNLNLLNYESDVHVQQYVHLMNNYGFVALNNISRAPPGDRIWSVQ